MSTTRTPEPSPHVDSSPDGSRLRVELVGTFDVAAVVTAMAQARHAAERCGGEFDVLVDVREFTPNGDALAALGEWETILRMAGASTVVRVGESPAAGSADRHVATVEEAEQILADE